jgi:uncharacterized protein YlzI (FlbEa/FlbD family)
MIVQKSGYRLPLMIVDLVKTKIETKENLEEAVKEYPDTALFLLSGKSYMKVASFGQNYTRYIDGKSHIGMAYSPDLLAIELDNGCSYVLVTGRQLEKLYDYDVVSGKRGE